MLRKWSKCALIEPVEKQRLQTVRSALTTLMVVPLAVMYKVFCAQQSAILEPEAAMYLLDVLGPSKLHVIVHRPRLSAMLVFSDGMLTT